MFYGNFLVVGSVRNGLGMGSNTIQIQSNMDHTLLYTVQYGQIRIYFSVFLLLVLTPQGHIRSLTIPCGYASRTGCGIPSQSSEEKWEKLVAGF